MFETDQEQLARQLADQKIQQELRINSEMSQLFATRESLCGNFFTGKTDIPELCLSLDDIGKGFEKISILTQYNDPGKSSHSNPDTLFCVCENSLDLTFI